MKRILTTIMAITVSAMVLGQSDTTIVNTPDTIHVGGFIIIKKGNKNNEPISDTSSTKRVIIDINTNNGSYTGYNSRNSWGRKNVTTNWFIFDLGFANLRDKTEYGSPEANDYLKPIQAGEQPFTKDDMKLNTGKTSNVNIWLFMQKLNVASHVLNLKYGLGYEMYNFRYKNNISYHKTPSYIFRDSVSFSKNKLFAGYATVPVMININATPSKRNGLSISAGVSAGYLIGSRNKQISGDRGKVKVKDDFDLEQWRLAYIAEVGIGPVRLYGSYSTNTLHDQGLKQYPYAVGVRFSNW